MASSCEKLDQLVKDYLLFRGFSATFKSLEQELKTDKDRGLRVDKMMEQIWLLISTYDLPGLREYWRYLNQRIFSRLDNRYAPSINKLESSLLKLYLVNAHQSGKQDKVRYFFEQMGPELQGHSDFKDWFAFPFIAVPSENPTFMVHFTKQWQDTLQLSLHNFLSVVLQAMPVPTLLNVEFDARRMKALQEENMALKRQLMNGETSADTVKDIKPFTGRNFQSELHPPTSPPDMVYDFSGLAVDSEMTDTADDAKQKTTRRFPLNLTSPLSGRKKSDASQIKPKPAIVGSTASSSSSSAEGKIKSEPGSKMSFGSKKLVGSGISGPGSSYSSHNTNKPGLTQTQVSGTSGGGSHSPLAGRRSLSSTNTGSNSSLSTSGISSTMSEDQSISGTHRSISVPEGSRTSSIKRMGRSADSGAPSSKSYVESKASAISENAAIESDRISVTSTGSGNGVQYSTDTESPFLLLEMDEYVEHGSAVTYGRFSPNGQYVASLDMDGVVKVWMWSPAPTTQATIMSKSAFLSLTWHHKWDRWLLLGNKSGSIRLFDVKESKTFREVEVSPDNTQNVMRVIDICCSPTGSHFVCATSDLCPFSSNLSSVSGRLFQWDLKALKLEKSLQVESDVCNAITCSCYTPTGQLITGGADGCVRIYDDSKPKASLKWQAHHSPIQTIQMQGKGDVYSIDNDGKLSQWNISQPGKIVNTFYIGPRQIPKSTMSGGCRGRLMSLDSSGSYLLTYKGIKGAIYKLEAQSGPIPVMELKAHQSPVMTVDWSSSNDTVTSLPSQDTKHCLTGSADGRIKISTLLSK